MIYVWGRLRLGMVQTGSYGCISRVRYCLGAPALLVIVGVAGGCNEGFR